MLTRLVAVFVFLQSMFCCFNSEAADENSFNNLKWRLLGPFRGGRVLAVTGIRGQRDHYYFGSVGGGVWESLDAGRTWNPIFDSMPIASIGAIAVAPSDPAVIYVGSGEADMRSDIGYGNGMYKSSDSGKSWKHIGLTNTHQIGRVLVNPENADIVFVAALGHAYGPNEERGVFRSTDGGETWQKVLYKDADTGAIDLAFGENSQTIYAALWRTRRPPWNVYPPSYGPGSGLYKTTDGGNSWIQIGTRDLPSNGLGRIGVTVAPNHPALVYAIVDAKAGGLYRSEDAGASWKLVSSDERLWQRGWYFGGITVDPKNSEIVYVCDITMYKSQDGGKTFVPFRGVPGGDDYHQLWIDPDDPRRMIAGVDQGAIITVNGGASWSSWYNQPIGQFYHVITDQQFPYWVYGTQQDSGAAGIPSRTTVRDGINMMHFHEITAGGENGYMAPDPLDPEILYGGTVEKLDTRTEQTQNIDPTLAYPGIYRHTWTLPLTFSPRDPHVLYFANQHLFKTSDGGAHWSLLSPDLTREQLIIPPNLDPVTAEDSATSGPRRGVIYAIAPSPVQDQRIWIGTDDGLVWITNDEGGHWQNVSPPALTPWSKVGIIEASHFNADVAYAAIDRHRLDDYKPYVYKTSDAGKSWSLIASGIPEGSFVNVVREDPKKRGLLYAGTELGIYISFDDGGHWQSLQMNLPVSSVRDIDVHGDDLVIGTHGRAFWALDNVSPLRQLDGITSDAFLFEPVTAYRLRPAGFTGTPMPKDEALAPNPPFGAVIDYYLKSAAQSPVTLEVLDASGNIVRHYSSDDHPLVPDLAKIVVTPDWFPVPQPLSVNAGHHRFVWDLHYDLPGILKTESKSGDETAGVWALPGTYTIRLNLNGRAYTQALKVVNDPRVKVTQQDLARQFEFAKRVEADRVQAAQAIEEIRSILKQSRGARAKASAKLAQKLVAFDDAVTEMTELRADPVPFGIPGGTPSKSTSLLYLNNALDRLHRTVDESDGAPTGDAITGFEKHHSLLTDFLKQWSEFMQKNLPPINRDLEKQHLPPLKKTRTL